MPDNIIQTRSPHIRLVGTDIDGVWTDAKMYYTENGYFMKAFSTYDGMAVQLLREAGIRVAILTSEFSPVVLKRAEKLQIKYVYIGEMDKLARIRYLCKRFEIGLHQVAYIGDDLNDLDVLKNVGISAMPVNSPVLSLFSPHIITSRRGGDGAFREFADILLSHR